MCRWFAQGAVDIYQCFEVLISGSHFENNGPVSILRKHQYRGHGGGVSVGLDCDIDNCKDTFLPAKVGVWIHQCFFRNNTSDPQRTVFVPASQSFRGTFPGRGGAVSIVINSTFEFNVNIADCLVEDNYAHIFGSGIFLVFTGYSSHFATVIDTNFTNNSSPLAGALSLGYIERSNNGMPIRLSVYGSRFQDNKASFGGAVFIFSGGKS